MKKAVYKSCIRVARIIALLEHAKAFSGRFELNGFWEDDAQGAIYWGSRIAVDLVKAYCDGYHACLNEKNRHLKR